MLFCCDNVTANKTFFQLYENYGESGGYIG